MIVTEEDLNKEVRSCVIPHCNTRCRVLNGLLRSSPFTLRCSFERSPPCHHRGWLEYQFDPFLVGSLYSWVARGTALMLNTGNV